MRAPQNSVSKGLCIAFLGVDGAGKTTVSEKVLEEFEPVFSNSYYISLHPLLWRKNLEARPHIPYTKPPRSAAGSVAKALYLWADCVLGWLVVVRPKKKRAGLIIFDRYYHDILIDPKRFRYGGPDWLARWIGALIPKPDLWIFLDLPGKEAWKRKKEVPLEESIRQGKAYSEMFKGLNNAVVVDASQPLKKVVADVNAAILDRISQQKEMC